MAISGRERILAALAFREVDRVPIDFGGTYTTSIYHDAYDRLKRQLGMSHPTVIYSKTRLLAIPDPEMLARFDVDTCFLGLGGYQGQQRELEDGSYLDEWGTLWRRADDGHFLYVDGPFFGQKKPEPAAVDEMPWPDPDNPGYYVGLADRAAALRRASDRCIILNMPIGIIHQGQFVRGFADWLKDLYKNRAFTQRMMNNIADRWIKVAENALDLTRGNVDVVFFGDDLASQLAPLFSPDIYRELIKPAHTRMVQAVKARADVKVAYHSCGAVVPLIEDLIDVGIDALNPVQVSARGMDPQGLKEAFHGRMAFWGGIDTQSLLPFGNPDQVRAEVRRMIETLGRGGGYVINSVHNMQNDVPSENVIALFDEARSYVPSWAR